MLPGREAVLRAQGRFRLAAHFPRPACLAFGKRGIGGGHQLSLGWVSPATPAVITIALSNGGLRRAVPPLARSAHPRSRAPSPVPSLPVWREVASPALPRAIRREKRSPNFSPPVPGKRIAGKTPRSGRGRFRFRESPQGIFLRREE